MTLYVLTTVCNQSADYSNRFINVFTYDVNDFLPSSAVANDLANSFNNIVGDAASGMTSILHTSMELEGITVYSPWDPTVLGILLSGATGTRTGTATNRFTAWGFKSQRIRADIRAGFKRFGIISEGDTSGNVPTVGMTTILNSFATSMDTVLTVSDGVSSYTATPIICKRIPYTTPGGSTAYRFPNPGVEYQYATTNWTFQAITSQVSRKN